MKLILTNKEIACSEIISKRLNKEFGQNSKPSLEQLAIGDEISEGPVTFSRTEEGVVIIIDERFSVEAIDLYADLIEESIPVFWMLKRIFMRYIKGVEALAIKWTPKREEE